MQKEIKKTYTVNVKPSVMEKAKLRAEENKRSLSSHVEMLLENDLKKERVFTEKEIHRLQSEVYKITGKGDVMGAFNSLLGVSVG